MNTTNSSTSHQSYDPDIHGPGVFGQVSVRPRKMTKFVVGMYERGMTPPQLFLEVTPQHAEDGISSSLAQFDVDDHTTVVCNIMNFGDVACEVRVCNGAAFAQ